MYELEINEDNIKETIKNDVLERNNSIYNFLNLVYSIDTKCTISIDGEWGTGKTFFVKQVEYIINLLNDENFEETDVEIVKMLDKIKKKLSEKDIDSTKNTRAIYYNACEYDYFDDPIITIIADIIKNNSNININNPDKKSSLAEKIDNWISSFKLGFSYQTKSGDAIGIELQKQKSEPSNSILDNILNSKTIEENFKQLLEELLVESSNRLIIFIDELDRCNPGFAVKLLEKIKYFFNDKRFIFVFSTNLNQLQHTIEKCYGNNFNGAYYLQKFFDYQLELPKIDVNKYINYRIMLIPKNSSAYVDEIIREVLKYENYNLRDCNKFFELLKLKYVETKNNDIIPSYHFFTNIMFIVLLAVKVKNINDYYRIINGNGIDKFSDIIKKCEQISSYLEETMNIYEVSDEDIDVLYNYMFIKKDDDGITLRGYLNLRRSYINKLFDKLSFLGEKITL